LEVVVGSGDGEIQVMYGVILFLFELYSFVDSDELM
jgi:hypothetical protein